MNIYWKRIGHRQYDLVEKLGNRTSRRVDPHITIEPYSEPNEKEQYQVLRDYDADKSPDRLGKYPTMSAAQTAGLKHFESISKAETRSEIDL